MPFPSAGVQGGTAGSGSILNIVKVVVGSDCNTVVTAFPGRIRMEKVYFYHRDKGVIERNGIGLLFVRDNKSFLDVLFECPGCSIFFKEIEGGAPRWKVNLRNPDIVPLTLSELCKLGLIDLVDGALQVSIGKYVSIGIK